MWEGFGDAAPPAHQAAGPWLSKQRAKARTGAQTHILEASKEQNIAIRPQGTNRYEGKAASRRSTPCTSCSMTLEGLPTGSRWNRFSSAAAALGSSYGVDGGEPGLTWTVT